MDKETRAIITTMVIDLRGSTGALAWYDKDIQAAHGYLSEAIDIMQRGGEHFDSIKRPLTAAGNAIKRALDKYSGDNQQLEDISRTISKALELLD